MSELYQSLSHSKYSKWDCKYHVVFVPKRGGKQSSGKPAVNWGRYSTRWRGRRNARFSKGISCQTMYTCASRFHRNIRWLP